MNKSAESNQEINLKPSKWDALVVLAVLALAALFGARLWFVPADSAEPHIAVTIDGEVVERLPFGDAERSYTSNGYTVHVVVSDSGVCVDHADCPTQVCVHTGTISRAGQSIICLPSGIVITVEGTAEDYDAIVG